MRYSFIQAFIYDILFMYELKKCIPFRLYNYASLKLLREKCYR